MADVEAPRDGRWQWLLWQAAGVQGVPPWAKALARRHSRSSHPDVNERTAKSAFGRLVELRRRERGLAAECLAERADLELADVIELEHGVAESPEPRTVFKLAEVLGLPIGGLMQLAGLAELGPRLSEAAASFNARLRPSGKLSREERDALARFVGMLNDP